MRCTVSLLIVVQFTFAAFVESSTYRFGRLGKRLTDAEVDEVVASLNSTDTQAPVAVLGEYSQVLPLVWYVDIFRAPSSTKGRVRRGVVSSVQCAPDGAGRCASWESVVADGEYAQVSDTRYSGFDRGIDVRTEQERPFRLSGTISDDELLSLVDYIRSQPAEPNEEREGWTIVGVSLKSPDPIIHVELREDGSVLARTSLDLIGGQTAIVVKRDGEWHLESVGFWVK
jgi:hypothetical protein